MMTKKTALGLSLTITMASLVHACQPELVQNNRQTSTGDAAKSEVKDGGDANPEDKKAEAPAANTGNAGNSPQAATNFTMTWDVSADPAIVSYKIFIVPPDRNPRFAGKTDVPVQIKSYPIAGLQKVGQKYSVVISNDEIKTALGNTVVNPTAYCFTIVAVNGVGNSSHSPVMCP